MQRYHQRPHHRSRSASPHDCPPRHSPPHDPLYPYENRLDSSSASSRPCPHCSAPPTSFHADHVSGDLVCTSCGSVLDDHLRDPTAEWVEYGTVESVMRGQGPGRRARGGDAVVDESRFVGGIQPTRMGGVFRGTNADRHSGIDAGSDVAHRLARVRQGLKRAHNQIEHLVDREQRERYKEIVVERRAREAQIRRGEVDPSAATEGIRVAGDYEGVMAARERGAATAGRDAPDPSEEERAYVSLRGERWSLQSALVLHGTLGRVRESVPPPPGVGGGDDGGWTDESLGAARASLRRRLDGTAASCLRRLCAAYELLDAAARGLGLRDGRTGAAAFGMATGWLAEYAARRDGIKVRGVPSSDSNLSGLSACDHEIVLSALPAGSDAGASPPVSSTRSLAPQLHRTRQHASLCSALLYLAAKRAGAGRTLAEVCGAFGTYSVRRRDGSGQQGCVGGVGEALVRPKFCGRAMSELKAAMPEVVVVPPAPGGGLGSTGDLAASLPSADPVGAGQTRCVSSASEASFTSSAPVKGEGAPDGEASASPPSSPPVATAQEAALADLVVRMAASLGLPRPATLAAVAVAVRCSRDGRSAGPAPPAAAASTSLGGGHIRPRRRKRARASHSAAAGDPPSHDSVAASSILLVCTAGGIMQRLARQALASSSSSDGGADAAPRPSLEPGPLDGAEVDAPPGPEDGAEDGEGPAAPCDVVSSSADDAGLETSQPAPDGGRDALSTWRAWADQPPWDRPVPSVVRASGLSRPDLRSGAYGTRLHPDRVRYLAAAAGDAPSYADLVPRDGGGGGGPDGPPDDICVAAPLMSLRNL